MVKDDVTLPLRAKYFPYGQIIIVKQKAYRLGRQFSITVM